MILNFDHYGRKENNFAQITITDEDGNKIDIMNIESINEEDFKKLFEYLALIDEEQLFVYEDYNR